MKIKTIRIENFRSFQNETITLNRYSSFVGPNGAGKSNVLSALNVFFQEQASSKTDTAKLTNEDYFGKNTTAPIRITVTFDEITPEAEEALSHYVRQGELVVTAEARFDANAEIGQVRHFGQRLGMAEFRLFFEAVKQKVPAAQLAETFGTLREEFTDIGQARSTDARAEALRAYEADHPERCELIESEDQFYGVNSTGMLARFVQWVYVPAVKDAGDEGEESRNSALEKLITRVVRTRTNFDEEIETLKTDTLTRYQELLDSNQAGLDEMAQALEKRLATWAHPGARVGAKWLSDPNKSVVVQQPIAGIKTGEGDFLGSLARMGHGLQRSYLFALLQELADADAADAPALILSCEEPELYQHPPQARHLADVFQQLAAGNNQVIVTSHSPLFVSGKGFEDVRLVRRPNPNAGTVVRWLTVQGLCDRIREAKGQDLEQGTTGLVAKIHQALQPGIAEMFFAQVPVLVEGVEDEAYITTQLHLSGLWQDFRRLGCHVIPVNGKGRLIQPLAIANEFGLPVFVVFDADGDCTNEQHRTMHEGNNRAIMSLLQIDGEPFPTCNVWGTNHAIWLENLTKVVKSDFDDDYAKYTEPVRMDYAYEGDLEKNALFIADWLTKAHEGKVSSATLVTLCENIIKYAEKVRGEFEVGMAGPDPAS